MGRGSTPDATDYWRVYDELAAGQGINVVEMAERVGANRSTFQTWKDGRKFPFLDIAVRIADVLGVTVEYMVSGGEIRRPGHLQIPPRLVTVMMDLEKLDEKQLSVIKATTNAITGIGPQLMAAEQGAHYGSAKIVSERQELIADDITNPKAKGEKAK